MKGTSNPTLNDAAYVEVLIPVNVVVLTAVLQCFVHAAATELALERHCLSKRPLYPRTSVLVAFQPVLSWIYDVATHRRPTLLAMKSTLFNLLRHSMNE
jgi:hypothetical protein